jgi:hypothetical protein
MEQDKRLNELLNARYVPEMRSNLPERIIATAMRETQKKTADAVNWVSNFFDMFLVPSPVYATLAILIISVFMGANGNIQAYASSDDDTETAAYFQAEDQNNLGDWS